MGKYYEFFAGGGMATAGLGLDWQCLFANDFCEKKASSYRMNWGNDHLLVADIATIKTSQLPEIADLAWASFPCQDLSLAGNGRGLNGERSSTFWAFVSLMKRLKKVGRKPRIIALENVYGAITSHDGADFDAIIDAVTSLGYRIGAMVIDAVHFVPQSRPRLFVVAIDDTLVAPPSVVADSPTSAWHPAAIIRAYNRLPAHLRDHWIWWFLPEPQARYRILDDIIEIEPQGVEWHPANETRRLLAMMTPLNRQKVMREQKAGCMRVGTIYRRMRNGVQRAEVRFDGVAGCLRTPGGGSSRQTIIVVDGPKIRTRLLSPREAARLMGLPDEYQLPERYNDAYKLAGDGVAVPVVAHLARHLFGPIIAAAHKINPVEIA